MRVNYSRFHQAVSSGLPQGFHPAVSPYSLGFWDGTQYIIFSTTDPSTQIRLDPDIRQPRLDRYSIGLERELMQNLTATATYARRNGRDYSGWNDIGGIYGNRTVTLQNGETLDVFPWRTARAIESFC